MEFRVGREQIPPAGISRTGLRPLSVTKSGLVFRSPLVRALSDASETRLVLVDAPVGYGKSTLLSQWHAEEDGRRLFAWVSLHARDSDPGHLVARLLESLRLHLPGFGSTVEAALEIPGSSLAEAVLPRLLDELAAVPQRLVIVLDDYHLLRGRKVHDLMERFVDGIPPNVQIAIATRSDPPLPLGRLRAAGATMELRAADLRFDLEEARALLESSGIALEPDDIAKLVEGTEGWPAGIYLSTLSLRVEPDPSGFVQRFAGTHRHVADYLSEEVLRRQPEATLKFLRRSSILDRMCASLCDALLDADDSWRMIEELEHSNLFVVALDDNREWYRYHQLFGQMLRAELVRTEPELAPELHRRASDWYEKENRPEEAIHYAVAAGDDHRSAELIARHWVDRFNAGRLETVRRWLDDLGTDAVASQPTAALTAGWVAGLSGQPELMERWLAVAERGTEDGPLPDGTASFESGVATVRGLLGYLGLEARRASLARAFELEPDGSPWRPFLLWGLGHVALLSGEAAEAKEHLAQALRVASPRQVILAILALAELAIAETEFGNFDEAMILVRRAMAIVDDRGLSKDSRSSGVALALGVVLVAKGQVGAGHESMERALELRRSSGRLSPWPTLEVLTALAPVRFMLGDGPGARVLLAEARTMLADLDDVGELTRRVEESERLMRRADRQAGFGETLTDREAAILRLLPTELSLREIGEQLFLSVNTVKTHTRAIYRKLGVSSRAKAVERAGALKLLEPGKPPAS
jgi:LuxR family transcriptional regulator, maltose regulon positive regulatory protein